MAASVASSIFPHPVWIVGFAGHRPHKTAVHRSDEALEATAAPIRDALRALNERAKESGGQLAFATSLAAGADIVAAEIAVELGLSLHLFLPLSVAEYADDFAETPTWWPRAQALLARAGDPAHG